jgi:hypothetical protein
MKGEAKFSRERPFNRLDLLQLGERMKLMDIVALSQGAYLQSCASLEQDKSISMELLNDALTKVKFSFSFNYYGVHIILKFTSALHCRPNNKKALVCCAVALYRILELQYGFSDENENEGKKGSSSFEFFGRSDPNVEAARDYFERAISVDPTDPHVYLMKFLNFIFFLTPYFLDTLFICKI